MNESTVKFTKFSKNPNNYEQIHVNLRVPYTQYSMLMIDSLTTNACFEVLNTDDYLKFEKNGQEVLVEFEENYSDLNAESFATLLDDFLREVGINCKVDYTNRIRFIAEQEFSLVYASYNVKTLLGIYDQTLPIISNDGVIQFESVGNYLSSPILYLIGSISGKCFIKEGEEYMNRQ